MSTLISSIHQPIHNPGGVSGRLSVASHRPRGALVRLGSMFSPSARAASTIALDRQQGLRARRLVSVARDSLRERRRPRRASMRSVVLRGGARLTWQDTPVPPPPGPLGAVVAPVAMATCDLDRSVGLGVAPFPLPLHFGHECVADVVSVGSAVRTVDVGDRVVVPFQISCGTCPACVQGLTGNCRSVPPISMYGFGVAGGAWGGAFSEELAVPYADAMLVPLPAGVDPVAVASAGDSLSEAYRHVAPHLSRVRAHPDGPRILVVGATRRTTVTGSSVPLYAGQFASASAPDAEVVLVEARPWVRGLAARLGLTAVAPADARRLQAPLVIDSSGDPRGLRLALSSTAPDGLCSSAGTLHASARIPASLMFGRNVTLALTRSHIRAVIPDVLALVGAGALRPEAVTTTVASFDDAPAVLRDHLMGEAVKTVLVRPELLRAHQRRGRRAD